MNLRPAVLFLVLSAAFADAAHATPLEELRTLPVSKLEFGGFKLETTIANIKDWPYPVEGVNVSFAIDPDLIEIVVAVKKVEADAFRSACAQTVERVRKLLYVDAKGVAPMGRSYLGAYFHGPWQGRTREAAFRTMDAAARIRVDVVDRGTCEAALLNEPVKFKALAPH